MNTKNTKKTTNPAPKVNKKAVSRKKEPSVLDLEPKENEQIVKTPDIKISEKKSLPFPIAFFVLIAIIVGLLGFLFKEKFIAAIVNGKPIFQYQLNKRLVKSFGKDTLENLIVEELIKEEAAKQKVAVSEKEIDDEVAKISKNLGEGTKIEDVLKMQNMTMDDLRDQLRMRIQVNKILEKDITISEEEVDKFIKDNGKILTASGDAEKKTEARERIKEQKIGEKVQVWINDLLSKAKISRFLK